MSKKIVIDASVVASWFFPEEKGGIFDHLFNDLDKLKLYAPSIFVYEFMNILLMAERKGRISYGLFTEIIITMDRLPISIDPVSPILGENQNIFDGARAHKLTSYDASYLELAVRLGSIPLVTYDKELKAAAKKEKLPIYCNATT